SNPPSEDSRPPSKRATTALPRTGDRPGRNGVTSTMAGVASNDRQIQLQQPNLTPDQRLALHPPALVHNPGGPPGLASRARGAERRTSAAACHGLGDRRVFVGPVEPGA